MVRSAHRLSLDPPAHLPLTALTFALLCQTGCGANPDHPHVPSDGTAPRSVVDVDAPGAGSARASEGRLRGDPRLRVVGLSVRRAPEDSPSAGRIFSKKASGERSGTSVRVRFVEPDHQLLGLDIDASRLLRFEDDLGRNLLDDEAAIHQWGFALTDSHAMSFELRTPKLPSPAARQISVEAELAIQFVGKTDTRTAVVPAGGRATVDLGAAKLELQRREGAPPASPLGSPPKVGKIATIIECTNLSAVEKFLHSVSFFALDGRKIKPTGTTTSMSMKQGESTKLKRFLLAHTEQPLRIELAINSPRTKTLPLRATVGLGLTDGS